MTSRSASTPAPLTRIPLHDGWTLTAAGGTTHVLRTVVEDRALPELPAPTTEGAPQASGSAGLPATLPQSGLPATVPGCVHTDLLAAGLIDDPYLDDNETRLGWIGRTDWTYTTTFPWTPDGHEQTDLVFEGLDTVATVVLNGTEVGRTANQHRGYRFGVRALLRDGVNTLEVRFTAPYTYAEQLREKLGARPGAYHQPFNFIRKMACNFGWDWGPTLVTSGIWRPVALESWSGVRIASVRLLADVDTETGVPHLGVTLGIERSATAAGLAAGDVVEAVVEVAGTRTVLPVPAGTGDTVRGEIRFPVPGAERWWPHDRGAQPLYDVTVTLGGQTWRGRTGFRTVTLERDAFRISLNDEEVFVRGVNWIPDDCFPTRLTRERLAQRLDQAIAAGVNLLRVWGGGLYESDDFYALADEKGLLVWQDFPFACAAYPEEQPLRDEVAAEARENIVRLAPHPSLVLWCGNNENLWGYEDWDWKAPLDGATWGYGYYHELLPSLVAELDPTRPYWPGTPYSGTPERHPNDPEHGTVHSWEVWNQIDYRHYADSAPRFVAEFGFQGPPAYATLRRAVSGDLAADAPLVAHHQKAVDGQLKLMRGLGDHLPQPRTSQEAADPAAFDDWHWLTQLNQARAVTFGIHHFRSHMPHTMGTIVWQLNDCWPVISWAAVDGDGRRKPLWYALRKAYADRLLVVRGGAARASRSERGGGALFVVNDSAEPWEGQLRLARHGLDGAVLAEAEAAVRVAPRDVRRVPLPESVGTASDASREVLVARLGDARCVEFFAEDTAVAWPEAEYEVRVTSGADSEGPGATPRTPIALRARPQTPPVPKRPGRYSQDGLDSYVVTVTARTILRDLALFPDRLDPSAVVDDMLITLLPGETATFQVTGAELDDPDALGRPPVLRCVNETQH